MISCFQKLLSTATCGTTLWHVTDFSHLTPEHEQDLVLFVGYCR